MPLMQRPSGKGKKIAFAILGIPAPLRRRKQAKMVRRDVYQNSY